MKSSRRRVSVRINPVALLVLAAAVSLLFNVPVLRPVLGAVFLTLTPGLVLLTLLRLDRLDLTERATLALALSISFAIFFGLAINTIYPLFGNNRPLAADSLAISFGVLILVLAIIGRVSNPDASLIGMPKPSLQPGEQALLVLPAFFPLMSILGTQVMNATSNNTILLILLSLIPAYVLLVALVHHRVTDKVYPPIILFIGISLVLLHALRSSHILGVDTHLEYYVFQTVLRQLHWSAASQGPLDSALSISLFPAIYQSWLNMNPEYLFKLLYPLLVSILPLGVYVVSRKYVGAFYAFLAAVFFMAQFTFLWTTSDSRTNIAILLFCMAVMALFHERLDDWHKRLLFVLFIASSVVSHYSSTYIFFFILLLTFVAAGVIFTVTRRGKKPGTGAEPSPSTKDRATSQTYLPGGDSGASSVDRRALSTPSRQYVTLPILTVFFVLIFFWYGQVVPGTLGSAVGFFQQTLLNLSQFSLLESRGGVVASILGQGLLQKGIAGLIVFIFSWLGVAMIGVGVITTVFMFRTMTLVSNSARDKLGWLREKMDTEFFVIALCCGIALFLSVVLPYVLKGYALDRIYFQAATVLSVFFVIGGSMIARLFRSSQGHWAVLVVLVPYLLCQTGVVTQAFGPREDIVLNSSGPDYKTIYVHDHESYCAKWLRKNMGDGNPVYSDFYGEWRLISQGQINPDTVGSFIESVKKNDPVNGYIFLRYTAVVSGELLDVYDPHVLSEYQGLFAQRSLIYANGGSEVWK